MHLKLTSKGNMKELEKSGNNKYLSKVGVLVEICVKVQPSVSANCLRVELAIWCVGRVPNIMGKCPVPRVLATCP